MLHSRHIIFWKIPTSNQESFLELRSLMLNTCNVTKYRRYFRAFGRKYPKSKLS